jgi:hypothetical protein
VARPPSKPPGSALSYSAGTQIAQVLIVSDDVTVEFSMEVVEGLDDLRLESIFSAVRATLAGPGGQRQAYVDRRPEAALAYLPVSKPVAPGRTPISRASCCPFPPGVPAAPDRPEITSRRGTASSGGDPPGATSGDYLLAAYP